MTIDGLNGPGQAASLRPDEVKAAAGPAIRGAVEGFVGTVIESLSLAPDRKAAFVEEWGAVGHGPESFFSDIAALGENLDIGVQGDLARAADSLASAISVHLHIHQLSSPSEALAALRPEAAWLPVGDDVSVEQAVGWMNELAAKLAD
ncbi:hypothetical protein KCG44_09125 [Pacificimonas sp. WHA3]|uniref:Uncharacterized protein n=1 Tax=Pacificimonas pallii TaxID=2827236 RepID=A0ABS6SEY0_9SPHN|nr:hypothetical protein [Pacificimonas pallii]MBV7256942.1 hypothetical protein [Pacificimonas pallii]